MHQLAAQIKQKARSLGFDLVGITSAEPSRYRQYLQDWLETGQAGTMQWMKTRLEERVAPQTYFPGARSVICVAVNYFSSVPPLPPGEGRCEGAPEAEDAPPRTHPYPNPLPRGEGTGGRIARYALGEDYHEVIKARLHELADWLRSVAPEAQTRCAVDTAPVMEKELAARAGIGWMGKHTCIINQQIGSWLLLGEILTTLDLPFDQPAIDRCGTCRRCIDACPTQAITAAYQLDARRCIAYLTIEHRGELPAEDQPKLGEWLFGCDICQEVCPWNHDAPIGTNPAFQPRFPEGLIELEPILQWRQQEYADYLRRSAIKRVKLPVLQRNARIVLNNRSARKEA